jgi:hypothetical protein
MVLVAGRLRAVGTMASLHFAHRRVSKGSGGARAQPRSLGNTGVPSCEQQPVV